MFGSQTFALLELRRPPHLIAQFQLLRFHPAERRLHFHLSTRQLGALHAVPAHANAGGFPEQQLSQRLHFFQRRQHLDQIPGTAFFHDHRLKDHVERALLQQAVHHVGQNLRVHVVDLALQHSDFLVLKRRRQLPHQKPKHVGAIGQITSSGAETHALQLERRNIRGLFGKSGEDCRSGWCGKLRVHARQADLEVPEQANSSGRGNGQATVRGLHKSLTQRHGGSPELLHSQLFQPNRCADHVGDRVQGTHLVKVNLVHTGAVDRRLRLRKFPKNSHGPLFDSLRQIGFGNDRLQVVQVPLNFLLLHQHVHFRGGNRVFHDPACLQPNSFDRQPIQPRLQRLEADSSVHQRTQSHVSADAGEAVEVSDTCGHSVSLHDLSACVAGSQATCSRSEKNQLPCRSVAR